MEQTNHLLLHLAVIIFLSKILGAISRKYKQPPVIGMLLLGIVLGPTAFHFIESGEAIFWFAKLGVLFLLFEAGLETDIKRIKKDSKEALLPALGGVTIPFIMGFVLSYVIDPDIFKALVIGVIFTATSVSISVITLLDLDKMKGPEGRCIINAAIIDDILGIILVTFIFGMSVSGEGGADSSNMELYISIGKIILFFVVVTLVGLFIIKPVFMNLKKMYLAPAFFSLSIAFVFAYSWFAEYTGIAAITGAYFAGLFLGQTDYKHQIQENTSQLGKSFFVDMFFVNIGLEINLMEVESNWIFMVIFVLLAISGKIFGSSMGARITGFDWIRSLRIGTGMIPRGEVALIIANMALQKNIIGSSDLSATIIMVIATAILTPILLKYSFTKLQRKTF